MCPDGSVSQAWTGEDDKGITNSPHPWLHLHSCIMFNAQLNTEKESADYL